MSIFLTNAEERNVNLTRLNWSVKSIERRTIKIELKFFEPTEMSPSIVQDRVNIKFLNVSLFYSAKLKKVLSKDSI